MVTAFAAQGASVVVASRKLANCEQVAEEIRAEHGVPALPLGLHVGRWDDLDAAVERIHDEFGRIDVLVNNAGMAPLYGSLADVSEELFDKTIGVNLKGPFRLSALVADRMAAGDGGAIVNISSFAAGRPSANDIPYAAAKAGLDALTKGFAAVYGPRVRVNGIAVGPFLTDISESWDLEPFEAWARDRFALQRLGQPDEIVGTVLYLASDASSFTTGAIIPVDGGVAISSPFPG
ncbi:SDR family oxidoreductase [Nitriliruptoraceae bacterium ZYF776]|nr:SDR family oxidoreductase [Profundirhabdus halotolerans]